MKSSRMFLGIFLATALLAGCGDGGDSPSTGDRCVVDADCDDGDFCSGIERCLSGVCFQIPRCDDGNACTTDVCVDTFTVQTCRNTCNASGPSDPCCGDASCAQDPACVGQTYAFQVTDLEQASPPCPFTGAQIDLILGLLATTQYNVKLPLPESAFTTVDILLPIPVIGGVTFTASRQGAELIFAPQTLEDIDLGSLGVPGFDCRVGGTATGSTTGFGNDNVQVTIFISAMSVTAGSGGCSLTEPGPACTLEVVSEGTIFPAP